MGDLTAAAMGVAMIGAFLLLIGGGLLMRQPDTRTRGLLMIAAAVVLIGNVLIWTL